jgi:hypothetical protein
MQWGSSGAGLLVYGSLIVSGMQQFRFGIEDYPALLPAVVTVTALCFSGDIKAVIPVMTL